VNKCFNCVTINGEIKRVVIVQAQVERAEKELRNRVASLQEDLDNNEATQQDFVQLSQSLQMELERLREAEKEVRWQHEDDMDECAGCRAPFSVTRRKVMFFCTLEY
jgi:Rab GTPase-binding effector protein 1